MHFISFRNEFNKFNKKRARMLDSIYHNYDKKITLKSHFYRKKSYNFPLCTQRRYGRHKVSKTQCHMIMYTQRQ